MSKQGEGRHFRQRKQLIQRHGHIPGRASGFLCCSDECVVVRMVVEERGWKHSQRLHRFSQSEFHKVLKLLLSLKLKELLRCLGSVTFWCRSEQTDLVCYFWIFQKDKKCPIIHILGISISIIEPVAQWKSRKERRKEAQSQSVWGLRKENILEKAFIFNLFIEISTREFSIF